MTVDIHKRELFSCHVICMCVFANKKVFIYVFKRHISFIMPQIEEAFKTAKSKRNKEDLRDEGH